ncbi:MAG: hypothetical protein ACTSXW_05520 [Candidatus Baldrarchaeia archaeon]
MKCTLFEDVYSEEGCDAICLNSDVLYLIEEKGCNISLSDANKVIKQLNFTLNWLRNGENFRRVLNDLSIEISQPKIEKFKVFRIFVYDKKPKCRFDITAVKRLQQAKVKWYKLSEICKKPEWKTILITLSLS